MLIELWVTFRELVIGAIMLIVSLGIHFFGMLSIQALYARRVSRRQYLSARHQMGLAILLLIALFTHLLEIVAWAIVLYGLDAIATMREAVYYVSVTYTTLGYAEGTLPLNWRILSPMIAISGLFAFGWTTGVMFNVVTKDTSTRPPPQRDPPSQ